MKKLKGKDGKEYTGCEKGGVFAIYNEKKENVGNYADEAAAVELGEFEVTGEVKADPPEDVKNDSSQLTTEGKKEEKAPAGDATPAPDAGAGGDASSKTGSTDNPDSAKTEPAKTPA